MSSQTAVNVSQLFQQAAASGELSDASAQALNVQDIGAAIQAGLGAPVDETTAPSEVVLVAMLVDDSGSIRFAGNAATVREGHNGVLDALLASKQKDNIFVLTRYLSGAVINDFKPLADAVRLESGNYDPNGGTPLYDQTKVVLGTVLAKTMEYESFGIPVRSVTLILTDGADEHSASTVVAAASVVKDALMKETHIVAALGIADGRTDFEAVFTQMGLDKQWILTPANNPGEIRRAFAVFSQSAVRASQSAQSFSKTAAGGFAA